MQEPQHFFKRKQEFPNHFAQDIDPDNVLDCENRINLLSECLDHIVCRLKIPYQRDGKIYHEGFFEQLSSTVKKNYGEGVQLYIGGGVVRSLLAYLYRHVHTKKLYTFPVLSTEEILIRLLKNVDKRYHPAEVLGVGSDLDIYYIFQTMNDRSVSDLSPVVGFNSVLKIHHSEKETKSATFLESFLKESVNAIEKAFHLSDYMDSLKKSFIPICDVKPYHTHLQSVMCQGGSHCDWLAFEFCGSATGKDRFKIPEEDPNILHSLLIKGEYAYTSPKEGTTAPQKQTIRGCRGLLELPFVKISEPAVLSQELINIKNNTELDYTAKDQLKKLVRNAYFGGANNRVYRSKPDHPLAILGALSVEQHHKTKEPYLIPYFLPGFFHQLKRDDLDLETYLISREQFIKDYTDDGILYHGTSQTGLLSIIRSGFWISDSDLGQGQSLYGPGAYCTPLKTTAESYTKESTVHYLQITLNPHYTPRILEWYRVPETVRQSWENCSRTRGYTNVFLMLREHYAIDIIINTHVILQNFYAIKVPHRLEKLIKSRIDAVLTDFDHENDLEKFTLFINQVIPLYYIAQAAAIKLNDTLLTLTERYPTLFLIKANYNPLAQVDCNIGYLSALAQTMDILVDGIDDLTAEKLFLSGAKYGLIRLMTTLWKAGISINVFGCGGDTAVHLAMQNECLDSITWLVRHNAILTLPNDRGEMPLHLSLKKSSTILGILKENAAYDFPLHLAAQQGNVNFLEELGAWSIDARDIFGYTPLHYAVLQGNAAMVDALLAQHADIDFATPEGDTAISLAINIKNASILQYLTRHKLASISLSHQTLFPYLNYEDDFSNALCEYFLSRLFFELLPREKLRILVILIGIFLKEGRPKIALNLIKDHQKLLKIDADYPKFDFFEEINRTLHDFFDDTQEALAFLKPFITIDLTEMDKDSKHVQDIFLSAVKYNFEEIVLFYLKAGIDINLCRNYKGSALSLSIQHGHAALLKQLADHGGIFSMSLSQLSLLDDLATENNTEIIASLRQIREENNAQYLSQVAARTANLEWILELPAKHESLFSYDRYGLTPMHYAAMEGHVGVMEALLQKGATLDQKTFHGRTVFHLAAKYGKTSVITYFATLADPAMWNVQDKKLNTVAHLGVRYGHTDIITALTTYTPAISTIFCLPNQKGKTPLELVWSKPNQKKNKLKIISSTLKNLDAFSNIDFANIMSQRFAENKKDFASLPKNYQCILKTLRNYRASFYHSPLHVAAREGNNAYFDAALSEAEIHQKDFYGFTPLHYAALKGHVAIVNRLLEQNAKVDTACYAGFTALHLAIIVGHTKIVDALIQKQAMLSLPFDAKSSVIKNLKKCGIFLYEYEIDGSYPMHIAIEKGYFDIVKLLIDSNVDLNTINKMQETPLDVAWREKNRNIIALLIKHGAQLNDYKKGVTLCHLAAMEEEMHVLGILIQQGVDLNAQENAGVTPAHAAAGNGKTAVIDLFLQQGVLLNSLDNKGLAPIHWAVAHGEIEVVTQLMQNFSAHLEKKLPTFCSPELLREKYCETILYFSNLNTSNSRKLSKISIARIEKLVATKMVEQGEHIDATISLEDLAYLTGNTAVLNYLFSQSSQKQNWVFPEKILNNDNYSRYQGCFFKKSTEQYPSYKNLIQARNNIEEEYDDYDYYDDSYDDYQYDGYQSEPSYDDDSYSYDLSTLSQPVSQLFEEKKEKLIFTVLDENNWGILKNKEISGYMFRFFDSKTSRNFGCLSKVHKNLQNEVEQEMLSNNGSLKK